MDRMDRNELKRQLTELYGIEDDVMELVDAYFDAIEAEHKAEIEALKKEHASEKERVTKVDVKLFRKAAYAEDGSPCGDIRTAYNLTNLLYQRANTKS